MKSSPKSRGVLSGALDQAFNLYLGTTPERCSYTIQPQRIPMSDGITLAADLYHPTLTTTNANANANDDKPLATILIQGCYGRSIAMTSLFARPFAARKYTVLFVSTRGTFGSGGKFEPGRHEGKDGQDVVRWTREQAWYTGSFATSGPSYFGYTQWALLDEPPSDCFASAILAGPHDYAWHHWGTGSLRLDRISWADTVTNQEKSGGAILGGLAKKVLWQDDMRLVLKGVPLMESVRKHVGDKAPWLLKSMEAVDSNDPHWDELKHSEALERVNHPILLVGGWYDPFAAQTMHQYAILRKRGCPVALTVGPWTHVQASGLACLGEWIDFLDEQAGFKTASPRGTMAKIYVTGEEKWHEIPSWPPESLPYALYLKGGNALSAEKPSDTDASSSFIYNPTDPTPSIGGPKLTGGGRFDDTAYASRSDLLTFTSAALEDEIQFMGKPIIHLLHTSDAPSFDLWIRLSEVDKSGTSHNICEAYHGALTTNHRDNNNDNDNGAEGLPLALELTDCAHRFKQGTKIRVIVAGSCFPMYARSLGTGEDRLTGREMRKVRHTISFAGGQSKLVLPRTRVV